MRFCNKTKEIIHSSYKTCTAEEIKELIDGAELTERSIDNIQRYVNRLNSIDELKEERRKKFELWAHKNPIKYRAGALYNAAKYRAKKKDIPFNLTKDWIAEKLNNGFCEATGIKFKIKKYSRRSDYDKVHPHAPSLDQINPSAGYTKDNVQVVCDQFNKMKSDKTIVQTVYLARRLVSAYDQKHSLRIKV